MEKIYLDNEASEAFGVPYMNKDKEVLINATPIYNYMVKRGTLDTHHKDVLFKHLGVNLKLEGAMYGWWTIKN